MKTPDDPILLLVAVFLELVQVLAREIAGIVLISRPNSVYLYDPVLKCSNISDAELTELIKSGEVCNEDAGIVLLVVFGLICLFPIATCLLLCCFHVIPCSMCCEDSYDTEEEEDHPSPLYVCCANIFKCKCEAFSTNSSVSMFIYVLQSFALTLYFFGDNLAPILHRYGSCVDCDRDCVEHAVHYAKVFVVISATMLHIFPTFAKYVAKFFANHFKGWEYKPSDTYQRLGVFGVLIKANSFFTTLNIVIQQTAYCTSTEIGLGWFLLLLCSVIVPVIIGVKAKLSKLGKYCSIFIGFLAFPLVFLFLLVDNFQPLDCAFHCDDPLTMPEDQVCCQLKDNFITRIVLIGLTIISAIVLAVVVGIGSCRTKDKRVKPE